MTVADRRVPSPTRLAALSVCALLAACLSTDDQIRTLQQYNAVSASPSTTPDYDWSVVIKNVEQLGVDMSKVGREQLAVAYLGAKCPNGKVVSETEMATTVPGQEAGKRDYALRVKC